MKFPLKRKSKSKWLAYYMSMRSAVFDEWLKGKLAQGDCTVLHLGCGLDSRVLRVGNFTSLWVDVDFPSVIEERKKYYQETENYRMLSADIREESFATTLPKGKRGIIVLEGVSMYLTNEELRKTLAALSERFEKVSLLVDCYTPLAAKLSKIKNPVKEVGVSKFFGIKNPAVLEENTGLTFVKEHLITPIRLINELRGFERVFFRRVCGRKIAKKLYKLYEYERENKFTP